jgi:hypothetical protein
MLGLGAAALVACVVLECAAKACCGPAARAVLWQVLSLFAFVAACVEINHWFGGSPPNFRTLYLNQIEVDSADFWTNRLLSSSSRSTAKESGPHRSITRTLKSG